MAGLRRGMGLVALMGGMVLGATAAAGQTLVLPPAGGDGVKARYVDRAAKSLAKVVNATDSLTLGETSDDAAACAVDVSCLAAEGAGQGAHRVVGAILNKRKKDFEISYLLVDVATVSKVDQKTFPVAHKKLPSAPGALLAEFVMDAPMVPPAGATAGAGDGDGDETAAGAVDPAMPEMPSTEPPKMPSWVIPAAIGGGVVMLLFVVFMIKKSSKARADTSSAVADGFARLGLQQTGGDQWAGEYGGTYRGRQVAMKTSAKQLKGASRKAGFAALKQSAMIMGGLGDGELSERKQQQLEDGVGNAKFGMKWAVILPLESPARVSLGRDPSAGQQIASNLYGSFDEMARQGLSSPQVHAALDAVPFDSVQIAGNKVVCTWAPTMNEYSKHCPNADKVVQLSQNALDALCTLCDALYGPVQPGMAQPMA